MMKTQTEVWFPWRCTLDDRRGRTARRARIASARRQVTILHTPRLSLRSNPPDCNRHAREGAVRIVKSLCVALLCLSAGCCAAAQEFNFPDSAGDAAALSQAMPGLARQVIEVYKDDDRGKYLDNLFRLQIVAGQYGDGLKTLASLRELRRPSDPARYAWVNVQYEIFARAKAMEAEQGSRFEETFPQAFREKLGALDDRTSALVVRALGANESNLQRELQNDLKQQKGKGTISLADALKLVHDYQADEAYRSFAPLTARLVDEDDQRRYIIAKDVAVKLPDGGTVCALVVRPRAAAGRLPALLEFTIYADADQNLRFRARPAASRGYVGIEALTRGKGCSPDKPWPYVRDGADAAALIDWISSQPWSDGRVGMYGGSYSGGAAWAAAKHMPKALKAIMVGAPVAPGVDVPMEGNVFWNFIYPWPFYTTDVKGLDDKVYGDNARWKKLDHDWYASGRAYRDMDKIDGTPNPIFDEWIAHPAYDAYWQNMIPYQKEFARINIPVLQTAGYYYGGPGAAVYYLSQHYKYNPRAEHYLLIGPYNHFGAQVGTVGLLGQDFPTIAGYQLDPVALIDLDELRYEWFDYVFKGGSRPALLKDKVNYQVTGANLWKHAPTLAAMADHKLRFHLSAARSGDAYRLSEQKPADDSFVAQTVNLADRTDVDRNAPGGGVLDRALDTWNGVEFISDPLTRPAELSGLFSGRLEFMANKKDFDFEFDLYELTPQGEYLQLAPYWTRASYAGDLSHRRLLTPGKRQRLDFESVRLMSRQLQPGSRVVAVLSVIKVDGRQINYGTGKDVSDETIRDAKEPLDIKWYSSSYLDLPAGR
jgi:putative CocE/NonD family hydrolase